MESSSSAKPLDFMNPPTTKLLRGEAVRPVSGLSGAYSITSAGRLYSHRRRAFLSPGLDVSGYPRATIRIRGTRSRMFVHRLVATEFCAARPGASQVNHKNGIKTDNRADNLEWVTASENQRHSVRTGLHLCCGKDNPMAKLTEGDVVRIRELVRSGKNAAEAGAGYGIDRATAWKVATRKSWKHVA